MRSNVSLSILACLAAAIIFVPPAKSENYVSHVKVGEPVPLFSAITLEGKEVNISAFKGKVVLLNFWATWCAPCQAEMPRLEKEVWKIYRGRDFEMIAIAREQTSQDITAYQAKYNYSFPMAPDPKRAIFAKFADAGIPRNYVVNPDGKIVYQSVGYSPDDFEKMKNIIEKELTRLKDRGADR
jgi:peroxiredoxin